MQTAPLKSVCEIIMGQAPSGDTYNDEDNGWPLIAGASDFGKITPSPSRFTTSPSKFSKVDDVIICIRATIGDLNWSDKEYCLGRGVASLRVDGRKADKNYIWRVVEYNAKRLSALGRGATFKQISKPDIADFEIPLPPLQEQKRIAAILDQADDIRRKRQHAIDRLNELGQAIFHEMFGDPIAPDSNNSERLTDIAELINGDRSSNYPSGEDIKDHGVLFLNTTNIKNGEIDLTKSQYISNEKFSSLTRGKLNRNDLVITLRGTLGQCALFDCGFETGFINAQMMIIRCHKNIMPRYLKEYISFPSMQKKLNSANTGSAVPQLTAAQMKEVRIIVPSLDEQSAFVSAINSARAVSEFQNKHITELTNLFTSLQYRAFTGQL